MSEPGQFEARLQKIRERFVTSLPERLRQTEAAFPAGGTGASRDDIEDLRFFAHDLAGIAPGLGFAALGQAGRSLEECAVHCLHNGGCLDDGSARQIAQHLQEIRRISREAGM